MIRLFHRLTGFYLASWLVLAWTVLWFCAGAAVTYVAIVAAMPSAVQEQLL